MSNLGKPRHAWIDIARGIAMLLVVLGHALIGAATSLDSTRISRFCILLIYCVHMPVLFALSGVLSQTLMTRPIAQFAGHMMQRLLWPYLLWGSLLLALHFSMSDYTNTAIADYQPLSILWHPPAVMWFLYVLMISVVLRRILALALKPYVIAIGLLFFAAPHVLDTLPPNLRFVGLYLMASTVPAAKLSALRRLDILMVCLALAALLIWAAWQQSVHELVGYPASSLRYLPALLVSPVLVYLFSMKISQPTPPSHGALFLTLLGRHSMAVFTLHIFCTAGGRIVLLHAGVSNLWIVTWVAAVLGLVGPLALAVLASRLRLGPVLGWQAT